MNVLVKKSLSFTASLIIAGFSIGSAFGQSAKVVGEEPNLEEFPSPEFGGKQKAGFKPKEWLDIEAKLKISLEPAPRSKTCEKLTVKWYVAVKNPEKSATFLLLTKDIDHVNAPLDEDVYCSVYLSPASIKRLTGSDKGGRNAVEYIGYEVLINGVKVVSQTRKGPKDWWTKPSNKISRSDTIPLLNKSETPFANMWWDRYAEVATPGK